MSRPTEKWPDTTSAGVTEWGVSGGLCSTDFRPDSAAGQQVGVLPNDGTLSSELSVQHAVSFCVRIPFRCPPDTTSCYFGLFRYFRITFIF